MPSTKAIIANEPTNGAPNWSLEDVEVENPGDNEVLVEMIASGVCHTDIVMSSVPHGAMGIEYPKVLGHEGAGYVRAKGKSVSTVEVGDPVLLSFASCQNCFPCKDKQPAYCDKFEPLNFSGGAGIFETKDGKKAWGRFFGQSSFAALSVVPECSVLNVRGIVEKDELMLFAPLGCGLQTGSGTVINIAKAEPKDVVLVMGLGGVGLAAIMGAKIQGCKIIIGMDRVQKRLDIAMSLGATHTIDTSISGFNLKAEVEKISARGASIVVDTTGVPFLVEAGWEACAKMGKLLIVGVAPPDFELKVNPGILLTSGKSLHFCVEGNAVPQEFIPKLIQWHRDGKFPFDKLVKFLPAKDFSQALREMHDGSTIKPILTW